MKKDFFALTLICIAFLSGLLLTAATSGCDTRDTLLTGDDALLDSDN